MSFKKGHKPWNKGKKLSKKIKEKISENSYMKGRSGNKHHNFGKHWKLSKETRKKISLATSGKNNPSWKNGKTKSSQGYILIYSPNHPNKYNNYYLEHKLVAEKVLGRYLLKTEVIHHIDRNKKNNDIDNLYLFKTRNEHDSFEGLKNKPKLKTNLYNPELRTI